MVSRTAEYAVRAALWLARHLEHPSTVRQIAEVTAVPAGYLAKILQSLGRFGLVRAQPGPGGGFLLSRLPEEITVIAVIEAVDPVRRIESCPLHLAKHASCLCPFHARLDDALALVQQVFSNCTLAQLLAESDASGLFCSRSSAAGDRANIAHPVSNGEPAVAPASMDDSPGTPSHHATHRKGRES